ncbi:MAG: hypothetical protein GY711_17985 [bacterium]|nr:hypothetical protein [bacterium]
MLIAAILCMAAAPESVCTGDDQPALVLEILRGSDAARDGEEDRLGRQLESLGRAAVPALFEVYVRGQVEAGGARLDPGMDRALVRALSRHRRTTLHHLKVRMAARRRRKVEAEGVGHAEVEAEAGAVMRVVGEFGGAQHIKLLYSAASVASTDGKLPRALEESFEQGLTELIVRDQMSFRVLSSLWTDTPACAAERVLLVAGATQKPEALVFIARVLKTPSDLDGVALAQISLLADYARPGDSGTMGELLVRRLYSNDGQLRKAAAIAAGSLRCDAAVPVLIRHLDSETRGERENAGWALRRITGQAYQTREAWDTWYAVEVEWFLRSAEDTFDQLVSDDMAEVLAAIRVISRRRLQRERLVAELLTAFDHPHPTVRAMAAASMGHLGCTSALPDLVFLLDDEDPGAAASAHEALLMITGAELPAEPQAWSELVAQLTGS